MLVGVFLAVDLAFFLANATKIIHGGWFPLVMGLLVFFLLTTWKRGRLLLFERFRKDAMPVDLFLKSISAKIHRVPGTAVFMTGTADGIPHALLHNLKHNKVLHERNLLLTVLIEEHPFVPSFRRLEVKRLDHEFYRVTIRYGFMEEPDVPVALLMGERHGVAVDLMDISFFLGRETIIPSMHPGMALWREFLFAWMSRNASSAMDFFRLPTNRVVELGSQVEI
jgi:KUP system potassium uptake protein